MSSLSGVPGGVHFPTGRWPDQIAFNKHLSTYLWSLGTSVNITALDHIHVVNYDQDGAEPYTMTLNLPVMQNLPAGSRIYFFYVSRAHAGDFLTFAPVPLSGDSVNGIVGNYTFTLTGSKALFICVGISNNYIIHPFTGLGSSSAVTTRSGIQSNMIQFVSPTPQAAFWTDTPAGVSSMFYPNATAMDAFEAFGDVDISSYLTPNVLVPTKTIYGFQVNEAGWYHINLALTAAVQFDSASGQNVWADLGVFTSAGVQKNHWRAADSNQNYYVSTTNYPNAMLSQYANLDVGDIVVFAYSAVGASIVTSTYVSASMTFVYYGPTIVPAAPLMFSEAASLRGVSSAKAAAAAGGADALAPNEIVMGSSSDTLSKRKELHKKLHEQQLADKRKREQQQLVRASMMAGGSGGLQQEGLQSSISLADVESIVRHVLRSSSVASSSSSSASQQPPSLPLPSSSSSSEGGVGGDGAVTITSRAPGKKRARLSEE